MKALDFYELLRLLEEKYDENVDIIEALDFDLQIARDRIEDLEDELVRVKQEVTE